MGHCYMYVKKGRLPMNPKTTYEHWSVPATHVTDLCRPVGLTL